MAGLALLIDTSIHGAGVGLLRLGARDLQDHIASDGVADSARLLPSLVECILSRNTIKLPEIDHVLVSRGPGSFTGIRVGIAYALGLREGIASTGASVRIAGLSSLGCLATDFSKRESRPVALFLAATKTTGYVAFANGAGCELMPAEWATLSVKFPEVFADRVKWLTIGEIPNLPTVPGGRAPESHAQIVDVGESVRMALGAMGNRVHKWGSADWDSAATLEAIYLRKSSVEEKAAAAT